MKYPHADSPASYLTIGLALLVWLGVWLKRRGLRTAWSLAVVSVGMLLMALGQFYYFSANIYYLGVGMLFFGIWLNGSFFYFYRMGMRKINNYLTSLRYDRGKL